jgi:hypothetical protein
MSVKSGDDAGDPVAAAGHPPPLGASARSLPICTQTASNAVSTRRGAPHTLSTLVYAGCAVGSRGGACGGSAVREVAVGHGVCGQAVRR